METEKENSTKEETQDQKKELASVESEISVENALFDMWVLAKKMAEKSKNNKN
jgi:hypothetical protein